MFLYDMSVCMYMDVWVFVGGYICLALCKSCGFDISISHTYGKLFLHLAISQDRHKTFSEFNIILLSALAQKAWLYIIYHFK